MSVNWLIAQTVDLNSGNRLKPVWEKVLAVPADQSAHTWQITVLRDGEPEDLTGYTVTASMTRQDGNAVIVSGVASGNIASVTFPQAVYAVSGILRGTFRISKSTTEVITLADVHFVIREGIPDQTVDPGTVVPNLQQLLAQISACEDATEAAENAVSSLATDTDIIWNQLIKNPSFSGTTDWAPQGCTISASGNVLTLTTASAGGSGMKRILSNNTPFVTGHKYLVRYDVGFRGNANGDASCQYRTYSGSSGATLPIHADTIPLTADGYTHVAYISTASATANSGITTGTASTVGSNVFKIKNFCVFDLTAMFGAGNEPAMAGEFEAMFDKPVYPYDAGTSRKLLETELLKLRVYKLEQAVSALIGV